MGANQRNGRLDERGMAPVGSRGPAPTAGPPPAAASVGDDERWADEPRDTQHSLPRLEKHATATAARRHLLLRVTDGRPAGAAAASQQRSGQEEQPRGERPLAVDQTWHQRR